VSPDITVPNTFTPNGDGFNDFWEVKALKEQIKGRSNGGRKREKFFMGELIHSLQECISFKVQILYFFPTYSRLLLNSTAERERDMYVICALQLEN
jgi:hypothetical protein